MQLDVIARLFLILVHAKFFQLKVEFECGADLILRVKRDVSAEVIHNESADAKA